MLSNETYAELKQLKDKVEGGSDLSMSDFVKGMIQEIDGLLDKEDS